nr:unnamed protein product [Callosobruchus chinensis]
MNNVYIAEKVCVKCIFIYKYTYVQAMFIFRSQMQLFGLVMPYLTASKLAKTIAGQQELVNLIAEKAEIDGTYDPIEENDLFVNRLMMCVDFIMPLFNANVESTRFTKFYCDQMYQIMMQLGNSTKVLACNNTV